MPRISAAAKLALLMFLLALVSLSFVAKLLWLSVPTAETRLEIAAGTPTERVLACAEQRIVELSAEDDRWIPEITRRDLQAGRLESGRFEDDNVTGFRVRLDYDPRRGRISLRLKGAGAYFTDQGVDAAMAAFSQRVMDCLSAAPAATR